MIAISQGDKLCLQSPNHYARELPTFPYSPHSKLAY